MRFMIALWQHIHHSLDGESIEGWLFSSDEILVPVSSLEEGRLMAKKLRVVMNGSLGKSVKDLLRINVFRLDAADYGEEMKKYIPNATQPYASTPPPTAEYPKETPAEWGSNVDGFVTSELLEVKPDFTFFVRFFFEDGKSTLEVPDRPWFKLKHLPKSLWLRGMFRLLIDTKALLPDDCFRPLSWQEYQDAMAEASSTLCSDEDSVEVAVISHDSG